MENQEIIKVNNEDFVEQNGVLLPKGAKPSIKVTVSFKLKPTQTKKFPMLVMVSYGGLKNKNGGYIKSMVNAGITMPPDEWDDKNGTPKDFKLRKKLLILEQKIKSNFGFQPEEAIVQMDDIGYLKEWIKKVINTYIHNKPDIEVWGSGGEHDEWKDKIFKNHKWLVDRFNDFELRLIDKKGREINFEKFTDLNYTREDLDLLIKSQQELDADIKKEDLYPVLFHEYIRQVGELKLKEIDLKIKLSRNGKRIYTNLAKKFEKFNPNITLGNMSDAVSKNFLNWLKETDEYNINTINAWGSMIKILKAVLSYATKYDFSSFYNRKPAYLPDIHLYKGLYAKRKENVINIFIDEQMLDELATLTFNNLPEDFKYNKEQLSYARDIFIIGCNTFSRFGDIKKMFNPQKYKDGTCYIEYTDNKTLKPSQVPISNFCYDLIKKYPKFKNINNSDFNKQIKEVCKLAGWTHPINLEYQNLNSGSEDDKIIQSSKPFYFMVKSHTMKRSACTNAYLRGVSKDVIILFSHHVNVDMLDKYIKVSNLTKIQNYKDKVIHPKNEEALIANKE